VTVVSTVLWIVFASQAKTHSDNANAYAGAIQAHPTSSKVSLWKSEGQTELDSYNSDKNLATAFAVVTIAGAVTTGITFVLLRKKGQPADEGVALRVSPTYGGTMFSLAGTF